MSIISIAIYALLWNTMTRFDGYEGNWIDELSLFDFHFLEVLISN